MTTAFYSPFAKTILFLSLILPSFTSFSQQIIFDNQLDKKDNVFYFLNSKYNGDVAVRYNNSQIKQRFTVREGIAQDTLINYFEDSKFDRNNYLDTSFCFMIDEQIKLKMGLMATLIIDTLKNRQEINNFIENEIGGFNKLEKLNERSSDGKLNKKNQIKIDSLNYYYSQQSQLLKSLAVLKEEENKLQVQFKTFISKPIYQAKIESIFKHENFIKNGFYKKYSEKGKLEKEGGYINDLKNGEWKEYDIDGSILLIDNFKLNVKNGPHKKFSGSIVSEDGNYTNGLMTGDWVYRHEAEGGFLKGKGNFINGDGTNIGNTGIPINGRNGNWVLYDVHENLTQEGNYSNGKLNGYFKFYHEKGKLKEEGNYSNDKRDGLYKSYSKPGVLGFEVNFIQDLANGICKFYHENGELKEEGNYLNGKRDGFIKFYFNSGVLESEVNYKQDNRDGICKMYHSNGKLKNERVYYNGLAEGIIKMYNENGIFIGEQYLKNDIKNGICKLYHENGKLKEEGNYLNGEVEGLYKIYHLNGKIKQEGNYKNGKPDGLFKFYNESGILLSEEIYENGKEKSTVKKYNENDELKKSGSTVYNDIINYQDKMFKAGANEINEMVLNGRTFTQKEYNESYKCKYCLKVINGWKHGYQSDKNGYNSITDDYLLKVFSPKGLRDNFPYCTPKCAVKDNE